MSLVLLILFTIYLMILSLISSIRTAGVYRDFALSTAQLLQVKTQIEMQKEYYSSLSAQINEVRAIRHDFHHFVRVLEVLLREKRYTELDKFLTEYAVKTETQPLPVFCNNIVINSVLGYYSNRFNERDIPLQCICVIPEQLWVSDSDLCVVLGNALENALEACEKLKKNIERFVNVEIRIVNDYLLIKIINTFNGELKQSGNSFLSTKKGLYHGIGLQNIKKVVDSYNGYVKTEHNNTIFSLMAAFPKP